MSCFEELLILEVKKHNIIYDKNNPNFTDPDYKNPAWLEIADKLGFDVEICKSTWTKLRNCHHQAVMRRAQKPHLKQWRFEELMSFIPKDLTKKPRRSREPIIITTTRQQQSDDEQSYQTYFDYDRTSEDIEYVEDDESQEVIYEIADVQGRIEDFIKSEDECSAGQEEIEELLDDAQIFEIAEYQQNQQQDDGNPEDVNQVIHLYQIDGIEQQQNLQHQPHETIIQQKLNQINRRRFQQKRQQNHEDFMEQENLKSNRKVLLVNMKDESSQQQQQQQHEEDLAGSAVDDNDFFFENLNQTVKKLPANEQNRLKKQFLNMMSEAELRQYNLTSSSSSSSEMNSLQKEELSANLKTLTNRFEINLMETKNLESYLHELIEKLDSQNHRQRDTKSNNNFADIRDQDSMFLLSLVNDFKQVPLSNKMLLKAQIAMHIANALKNLSK